MPPLPTESIGWPITCREDINRFLSDLSEYDKLGFAAGTTIQALIPLLISVWGLPTADIRELVLVDEGVVAFLPAGLTFGLPVRQKRAFLHIEPRDLDRNFLQQIGHRKPSDSPRSPFAPVIFCLLQAAVSAMPFLLNHLAVQDLARPLWACTHHPSLVWHAGVLGTIPVVGSVWYFALRLTLPKDPKDSSTGANDRLVLYRTRKGWKHPIAVLLPGLLQGLLTLFYSFMFTTLYSTSIKSALIRVALIATLLFCSRALSVVYADWLMARKPRVLFHYEDDRVRDEVIRRYKELEKELENAALAAVPADGNGTTATAPTATAPTSTLPLQP